MSTMATPPRRPPPDQAPETIAIQYHRHDRSRFDPDRVLRVEQDRRQQARGRRQRSSDTVPENRERERRPAGRHQQKIQPGTHRQNCDADRAHVPEGTTGLDSGRRRTPYLTRNGMKKLKELFSVGASEGRNEHRAGLSASSTAPRSARSRLRLLQTGMLVFFCVICLRLAQVQVVESVHFREIAQKQYQAKVVLPSTRGNLCDRNGNLIASNSMFVSFAADPEIAADDARAIAKLFSKLFGKPVKYYLEKLHSDSRFVWLERQVRVNKLTQIDPKKPDALAVRYEPKRLYH